MLFFFRCFPELERLRYEHGDVNVSYGSFQPRCMMAAIDHLKHCLKEVAILGDDARYPELEPCPLGSFADFDKLTSIETFMTEMIGKSHEEPDSSAGFPAWQELVDSVPSTLESLTLRECKRILPAHLVSQISRLVSQKHLRTPALKKIDFEWESIQFPDKTRTPGPVIHPGFTKEEAQLLIKECEKAGIELVVNYLPSKLKWVSCSKTPGAGVLQCHDQHIFHYPYEGYEKVCEEHGCDPATGRRPGEIYW